MLFELDTHDLNVEFVYNCIAQTSDICYLKKVLFRGFQASDVVFIHILTEGRIHSRMLDPLRCFPSVIIAVVYDIVDYGVYVTTGLRRSLPLDAHYPRD